LVVLGGLLYSVDADFPTAGTPILVLPLVIARRLLKRGTPWGWGMLTLAAAISYSRVYVGVHWPTDVAEGVVLGLASGWVGVRLALRGGSEAP
jgi:undecaprenyl-diphosphatase